MNDGMELVPFLLVLANGLFSWQGFKDRNFFGRWCFHVGSVRRGEYLRLVSSGFLHLDIPHLAFNMLALYSFAAGLSPLLGVPRFLLLYFASLLAGNLLSLWMHRRRPEYTAAGASGAVSGVIFAGILLFPESRIMLFLIPVPLPGWVFALAYIAFSLFGMKKQWGNLGHDAHLGGALAGVLLAVLFFPALVTLRPLLLAGVTLPPLAFLGYEWYRSRPRPLRGKSVSTADQEWLDGMLDRISERGIGSLSAAEKRRLHRVSREKRQG